MKRITILERTYTTRELKGFFKEHKDIIILIDKTNAKLEKELQDLNKTYRSNFYKVVNDFNVATKKGTKEWIHFLVDYTLSGGDSRLVKINDQIKTIKDILKLLEA